MRLKNTPVLLFISLIALNSVSFMATHLYVPAMPSMSLALGVKDSWIQASLTAYMIPFALLPVLLGPYADNVERRKLILISLFITLIGSTLILLGDLIGLLAGRFLQGGAFGLITVSARALIADCFKGKKQAQYHSLVQCFSPIVSISSPLLGGIIHSLYDWEGIFIFLMFYSALLWLLTRISLPSPTEKTQSIKAISFKNYWQLVTNKSFMQYACLPAFMMIGQSGFTCMSAYIFQNHYGLTSKFYGLCTLPIYGTLIISALLNIRLLQRIETHCLMAVGSCAILMAGGLLAFMEVTSSTSIGLLIISCMLFFLSNNFLVTNAYAKACEHTQGQQGCAFAFMSLLKMSAGIVTTILATWLPAHPHSLMVLFLISGFASITLVFLSKVGEKVIDDEFVYS